MRILIVEDEFNLADAIKSRLKEEKYSVDISCDGEEGLYNILNGQYDLVILDVMLPHKSGFEILKEIRKRDMAVKVIILTAKDLLEDKLNGFEYGANDYLTKPFYMEELIARANVWLRNNQVNVNIQAEIYNVEVQTTSKAKTYRFFLNDYDSTFLVKYTFSDNLTYDNTSYFEFASAIAVTFFVVSVPIYRTVYYSTSDSLYLGYLIVLIVSTIISILSIVSFMVINVYDSIKGNR